jgi:hypothetical protein
MGTGHCGLRLLARILGSQPDALVTHEQPPLLSWELRPGDARVKQRLERLLATRPRMARSMALPQPFPSW